MSNKNTEKIRLLESRLFELEKSVQKILRCDPNTIACNMTFQQHKERGSDNPYYYLLKGNRILNYGQSEYKYAQALILYEEGLKYMKEEKYIEELMENIKLCKKEIK